MKTPTSTDPHTTVIFTHGGGRMANQFVAHAHLLAFCFGQTGRFSLVNTSLWPYCGFLEPGAHVLPPRHGQASRAIAVTELLRRLFRLEPRAYRRALPMAYQVARRLGIDMVAVDNSKILDGSAVRVVSKLDLDGAEAVKLLGQQPVVLLSGWEMRAPRQILNHRGCVLSKLMPRREIRAAAESTIRLSRRQIDFLIGVHIRHGDYRGWSGGKYWFPVESYVQWMRQALERYANRGRVGFYVCSDAMHDPNIFGGLNAHLGWTASGPRYNGLVDCLRLSQCDLILHPPSTFSWWAAYMGDRPRHELNCRELDVRSCPMLPPPSQS
jgi:hypothetical protein